MSSCRSKGTYFVVFLSSLELLEAVEESKDGIVQGREQKKIADWWCKVVEQEEDVEAVAPSMDLVDDAIQVEERETGEKWPPWS